MKCIIVANWKMHPASMREAKRLFEATRRSADAVKNVSVIVAPPNIFLRELSGAYKGKRLSFAAQNGHYDTVGARTGEVSLAQVKDARASYVILGHSERRAIGETNEDVRKKVEAALALKLTPIVCVGESERRESGSYFNFIREELRAAFSDVKPAVVQKVIVAYEPIWAIGGEKAMAPHQMHEMSIFIRKTLMEMHGEGALKVRILYGGSVNEDNAREMREYGDVVGFIVGHVSVEHERFDALLKSLV